MHFVKRQVLGIIREVGIAAVRVEAGLLLLASTLPPLIIDRTCHISAYSVHVCDTQTGRALTCCCVFPRNLLQLLRTPTLP